MSQADTGQTLCEPARAKVNLSLTVHGRRPDGYHYLESLVVFPDIHDQLNPGSEKKYIYIFTLIALFIIAIACINFMNLSTARSSRRAREVGLR